jgi:nucleotide sugar dehydrogenase
MKITVIGTGYVGLVSGTCFAEFGFHVTCVDKDSTKIEKLHQGLIPIYEPGLDTLVKANTEKNRLSFTTDLKAAVSQADVIFIAVGTPTDPSSGHADMRYVYAAVEAAAEHLTGYTVIGTKSTAPVGTVRKITQLIKAKNLQADFDVISNPEFLREGSAIQDFMRPHRIVIGCDSPRAREVMQDLYYPLSLNETPILYTDPESAELIKYAANAFLATKIAFINQMADMAEKCGADVQLIAKGMGLDPRIGAQFLLAGPGYGGSCFPKDTLALLQMGKDYQVEPSIVKAVIDSNAARKKAMAQKIITACKGSVAGKKIAVLGLTFKANTDDMRDSPSLDIIPLLQQAGAQLSVFDPQGHTEARHYFSNITYGTNEYDIMKAADALVILTEWNEFRALDLEQVKALLEAPLIIDLRNLYPLSEMQKYGFEYHSIGRREIKCSQSALHVARNGKQGE